MHIGSVWIEIPNQDKDTVQEIARCCFDANQAVMHQQIQIAESIFSAVVMLLVNIIRDQIIYKLDWDMHQESFIHEVESNFVIKATSDLLDIAQKRITHKRKKERFARTSIEDLKLSAILIYIMELPDSYEEFLEEKIALEYDHPKK